MWGRGTEVGYRDGGGTGVGEETATGVRGHRNGRKKVCRMEWEGMESTRVTCDLGILCHIRAILIRYGSSSQQILTKKVRRRFDQRRPNIKEAGRDMQGSSNNGLQSEQFPPLYIFLVFPGSLHCKTELCDSLISKFEESWFHRKASYILSFGDRFYFILFRTSTKHLRQISAIIIIAPFDN